MIRMEKKLVHVAIVDGTKEQIKELIEHLNILKKSANLDYEFLVTNDTIKVRDVRWLLEELYLLMKRR